MPESTRERDEQAVRVEGQRPRADALILTIEGEADLHVALELRDRLVAAVDEGATLVVVDLSETTIVDSVTLGALMAAMKRLRARGGQLRLVVRRREVRRTFEVALADRIFPLHGSREEALAAAAEDVKRRRSAGAQGAAVVFRPQPGEEHDTP